ncbi:MAG TPA: DUF4390 domain-containing protein [Lautropia sp.]|nr:DUF4390 domain-containing protein [Lautropia sp.]
MNRRPFLAALGCAVLLTWMRPARSGGTIEVEQALLDVSHPDDLVLLSADFVLSLTETLRDAVNRGLPLYFLTEVQIQRGRWYWLDETLVSTQIEWRLSYHALTRQFRVASSGRSDSFESLEEAIAALSSVKRWQVAPLSRFQAGTAYMVWVRMRLDTTRLPKPFQMAALTDRDWNPESEWKRFAFTAPTTPTSAQ